MMQDASAQSYPFGLQGEKKYYSLHRSLLNYYVYIDLVSSLIWGSKYAPSGVISQPLNKTGELLKRGGRREIAVKGPAYFIQMTRLFALFSQVITPKADVEVIIQEYIRMCSSDKHPKSYGLEYGWIRKNFEFKEALFGFPVDTPYYANVGLSNHSFSMSVEERFLIEDAFFNLAKAEFLFSRLVSASERVAEIAHTPKMFEFMNEINIVKSNICSYARHSVVTLFAFLESFINGVAYSHKLQNLSSLSEREIGVLDGIKDGRYFTLEKKMESIPTVIRPDKQRVIILSDKKQAQEPFVSLLGKYKELRDASMHYSKSKADIWKRPNDWIDESRQVAELILEASLIFWRACYPGSTGPKYLYDLNFDQIYDIAANRQESELSFEKKLQQLF